MTSRFINQKIFDLLISTETKGLFNKFRFKILNKLRNLITQKDMGLVKYRLYDSEIYIPFDHNLPLYRRIYKEYSSNVGRIASFVKEKYSNLSFIDIGANIGDTVAILRKFAEFPILCIEGNEKYSSILQKNMKVFGENVYLEKIFIGNNCEDVHVKINAKFGTGHLVKSSSGGETIAMKTLSEVLEKNNIFNKSKMLKIDTDGFDICILESELSYFSAVKPVIFFEYDPFFFKKTGSNGLNVFHSLKNIGYENMLVYENNGDYLMTVNTNNTELLNDLYHFYSGRAGERYCDICIFHADDNDLCKIIRSHELKYFNLSRGG